MSRDRNPHLKSTDYKPSGMLPPGLSGSDMAFRMMRSPDHETGENTRGRTRRFTGTGDALSLALEVVPPWHRDALCAEPAYDQVPFYGATGRGSTAKAKEVCARCLVQGECLDEALSFEAVSRLPYGIRGGLSAEERMVIIRREHDEGTIYFGWGRGLIKIGTTRSDPQGRARHHGIRLLATEPGSYTRERQLHRRFSDEQQHGEWFHPSERLLAYIKALPDQVIAARSEASAA